MVLLQSTCGLHYFSTLMAFSSPKLAHGYEFNWPPPNIQSLNFPNSNPPEYYISPNYPFRRGQKSLVTAFQWGVPHVGVSWVAWSKQWLVDEHKDKESFHEIDPVDFTSSFACFVCLTLLNSASLLCLWKDLVIEIMYMPSTFLSLYIFWRHYFKCSAVLPDLCRCCMILSICSALLTDC